MSAKTDGEKIVEVQTQMIEVNRRLTKIDENVGGLYKKLDDFRSEITNQYVPMRDFNEFKLTKEKELADYKLEMEAKLKNKFLEQVIVGLTMLVIGGLVGFFFRAFGA